MLKKVFLIGLSSLLIILCGCSEKEGFQYEFDNFYGIFNTDKSFEVNKEKLESLGYKILVNNIIKIYVGEDNPNFTDSIIITKKSSDKSVEAFGKEHLEDVELLGLKMTKGKKFEIKCENTYDILYYQGKYSMNQYNVYLTYGFLKVGNEIYIISYATLDEKSRNDFSSSFKTLVCK